MGNKRVSDAQLTDIADAIRSKTGSSSSIVFPDGFVNAISGLGVYKGVSAIQYFPAQDTTVPAGEIMPIATVSLDGNDNGVKTASFSKKSGKPGSDSNVFVDFSSGIGVIQLMYCNNTSSNVTLEALSFTATLTKLAKQ